MQGNSIPDSIDQLVDGVQRRDKRILSHCMTVLENGSRESDGLLDALYPLVGGAWRIGITGPPGAGKSALSNQLIKVFLERGDTVGYVAVDPTSPFTGGAILADRVRIEGDRSYRSRLFTRSVATRGATGGLSTRTGFIADVLDAAGYSVLIVETVGVGQAEIDVAGATDTIVVVLVPESGDEMQAMKAGLLEIADILCVNKADRPGATRLAGVLQGAMGLRRDSRDWNVPIVSTIATGAGQITALADELARHRDYLISSGTWRQRRTERFANLVKNLVRERWEATFWGHRDLPQLEADIVALNDGQRHPASIATKVFEATDRRLARE